MDQEESKIKKFFRETTEKDWIIYALVFVSYFGTAKLGQYLFNHLDISPAVIWAPAGIALAAVFLRGYKMLVPIFIAQFLSSFTNPVPMAIIIPFIASLAYTLQAFLGAYVLKKFKFTGAFDEVKEV